LQVSNELNHLRKEQNEKETEKVFEEIAQKMKCPVGTVRSRIFRAREAVDKILKPLL
jgi:RNA polymerase sigma-70 factor (ECF subfamily)